MLVFLDGFFFLDPRKVVQQFREWGNDVQIRIEGMLNIDQVALLFRYAPCHMYDKPNIIHALGKWLASLAQNEKPLQRVIITVPVGRTLRENSLLAEVLREAKFPPTRTFHIEFEKSLPMAFVGVYLRMLQRVQAHVIMSMAGKLDGASKIIAEILQSSEIPHLRHDDGFHFHKDSLPLNREEIASFPEQSDVPLRLSQMIPRAEKFFKGLDLSNNGFPMDELIRIVESLHGNNWLCGISLSHMNFGNATQCLEKMLEQNTCLHQLILNHTQIGDEGMRRICHGMTSFRSSVRLLSLAFCNLGGMAVKHLADMLIQNTSLVELRIGGNPLGDFSLDYLVQSLIERRNPLKILGLEDTQLTSYSLPWIEKLVKSQNQRLGMTQLMLDKNNFSTASPEKLVSVLSESSIEKISLSQTGWTANSFEVLHPLIECLF
jgi:hypothetical protein